MTDKNALLPCPFCGGPVELETTTTRRKWWGVVCRNTLNRGGTCAIQQIPSGSPEAATERWNKRSSDTGIAELERERDELAGVLADCKRDLGDWLLSFRVNDGRTAKLIDRIDEALSKLDAGKEGKS